MSKKKQESEKVEEVVEKKAEVKADAAPAPKADKKSDDKKPVKEKPEPLLTFSRYFAHTGKPEHHKAGMVAWLKKRGGTNGRRTAKSWTDLFSKY